MNYRNFAYSVLIGCLLAGSAAAQFVISARSGLIHYIEGDVLLEDKAVVQKLGEYPEMKVGQHLRTETGRAEVLLTPGAFLRLSENSEIVLTSNALTDTKVDVVKGSVLLEASEISKEHGLEFTVGGQVLEARKRGVFRIDATDPPRVRAFDGEITIAEQGRSLVVKEGRQAVLTGVPVIEKFTKEDTDAFYRWAGRRSGYLALANASAARRMYDQYGTAWVGGWYFNPYFGMFTFVPGRGHFTNAWNHSYYAPFRPAPSYQPMPMDSFAGMSGSRGMSRSSGGGYSGGGYQAPATSGGGSAPVAGPARSAGGGGGSRGGGGGGRR